MERKAAPMIYIQNNGQVAFGQMKVGREMNIKLKEISRDDLKVGDTVGIARTVNCGWLSTFRHRKIIPVKITRITPKRTKIETDIYEEHGKGEKFYEYDENARKENELLAEAIGKVLMNKMVFQMPEDSEVEA